MVRGGARSAVVMLSFLEPVRSHPDSDDLVYGRSVTDKCMGWDATEDVLRAPRSLISHNSYASRQQLPLHL